MNIQKYFIIALCFICLTNGALFAQSKNNKSKPTPNKVPPSSEMAFDSTAHQFGQTIQAKDLKKHLSVLASDEYQGRETGEKGQQMAADYIVEHFKSLGMKESNPKEKSYFQKVPLQEGGWENPTIKMNGEEFKFLEDFYCFPNSTQQLVTNADEIVFLGYGIQDPTYDDYKSKNLTGKVILIMDGEPQKKDGIYHVSGTEEPSEWSTNWRKKLLLAKSKGVKAIFIVDESFKRNVSRFRPYINSRGIKLRDGGSKVFANSFYVSPEMVAEALQSDKLEKWVKKINKKGRSKAVAVPQKIDFDIKKKERIFESENVMGFLEGSDLKDEIIIVTAHYDHLGTREDKIFNGADDDGSGTVALLEMAEAFTKAKEAGHGPRRSILFMTVTGEEKGLLGSEFYVTNPVYPLENSVANLNIDMVGRTDDLHEDASKNYVYVIGSDRLSTELHTINEKANDLYVKMNLDYKYNAEDDPNRFYFRSDHYNFAKNNIPIIFYFNGTHEDYHKETDTVDKIEFDMLEARAKLVFYTAWQLANQDQRIEVDVVDVVEEK